jgi:hypothetical protein
MCVITVSQYTPFAWLAYPGGVGSGSITHDSTWFRLHTTAFFTPPGILDQPAHICSSRGSSSGIVRPHLTAIASPDPSGPWRFGSASYVATVGPTDHTIGFGVSIIPLSNDPQATYPPGVPRALAAILYARDG